MEYFKYIGNKIEANKNNKTITNKGSCNDINCGYGSISIEPNIKKRHFWSIHIRRNSGISIGLDQDTNKHINAPFKGNKFTPHYSYYSKNGKIYSQNISDGRQYAEWYYTGDIICMLLDGFTLSFCKLSQDDYYNKYNDINNYPWKIAENMIQKNTNYRLCVELTGSDGSWVGFGGEASSVQLLDYKCFDNNNINDIKQENKEENEEEKKSEIHRYPTPNKNINNNNNIELKESLIFLEKQLSDFNNTYNKNDLLNIYHKSPKLLVVDNEINKLEIRLKACSKHLEDIKNNISTLLQQTNDEENECVVCMEGHKCYVCEPCGHLCLCKNCKDVINEKCPMCQEKCTAIKLFK